MSRPGEGAEGGDDRLFARVLVPLDGSRLSLAIVEPLARLIEGTRVELTLLRVVDPRSSVAHDEMPAAELTMALQLAEVRARLGLRAWVRSSVVRGDPAEEIVRHARDAELVAMTTHGRSGVERLLRGSVAEEVLRTCDRPLLLCNPSAFERRPEVRFERLLVALDGTDRSARVLPLVERVARVHHAHVKALHVEPPAPCTAEAVSGLSGAVGRLRTAGVDVEPVEARGPSVTDEILEAADEADLLAMATHGRSGVSRWWFGSVTEEVLRHAHCPLLVVRTA